MRRSIVIEPRPEADHTMSDTVLVAETGRTTGSAESRRLRAQDLIPAVLYGQGMEPLSLTVARRDLRQALSGGAGANTVLDLTVDGSVYPAIVKEMQRHPIRRTVLHVDFLQLNLAEEITVSVPLRLEGEATEVTNNNGMVEFAVDSIDLTTTPRNIPDEIVIDISDLTLDSVIRLADLALPEGVAADGDPEMLLVTVSMMKAEATQDAEGEADEAADEAAPAAEAGEAAADDAE